jgi:hypothetical protein
MLNIKIALMVIMIMIIRLIVIMGIIMGMGMGIIMGIITLNRQKKKILQNQPTLLWSHQLLKISSIKSSKLKTKSISDTSDFPSKQSRHGKKIKTLILPKTRVACCVIFYSFLDLR